MEDEKSIRRVSEDTLAYAFGGYGAHFVHTTIFKDWDALMFVAKLSWWDARGAC
ncbi:MAG: hypothetical protein K2N35_05270 [Muribaculaceae bacterium]|nr:hypothetical protein [Muribaculaceae bacterium]